MGKYFIDITEDAKKQLALIRKSGNKTSVKRVEQILKELSDHPETGIEKPERLKFNYSGYWSRQINLKDRLIYKRRRNNNCYYNICIKALW